jgi:hypothetical protein
MLLKFKKVEKLAKISKNWQVESKYAARISTAKFTESLVKVIASLLS